MVRTYWYVHKMKAAAGKGCKPITTQLPGDKVVKHYLLQKVIIILAQIQIFPDQSQNLQISVGNVRSFSKPATN